MDILTELGEYKLCGNLLSLHLDDLGLSSWPHLVEEIMDIFQIKSKRALKYEHQGGLHTAFKIYIDKVRGVKYQKMKADDFNYSQVVKQALAQRGASSPNNNFDGRNLLFGLHLQ